MMKLQALTDHIKRVSDLPDENVFAYFDDGRLIPTGHDLGNMRDDDGLVGHQIELGLFEYDAVIEIERYPGGALLFMGLVTSWLADHDDDRDGLDDPGLDAELNIPGKDCDLQIGISFRERITVIEDENGPLPFNGKRWRLHEPVIVPAEELEQLEGGISE